jgi:hypothetical protein
VASRFRGLGWIASVMVVAAGIIAGSSVLDLTSWRDSVGNPATPTEGVSDPAQPSDGPAETEAPESVQAEPTAEPDEGWTAAFTIEPGPYNRVRGVAEARGALFALGRSDRTQPAVWISHDGTNWSEAQVPAMSERVPGVDDPSGDLAAMIVDVVDSGDRLVALGNVGLADGSGLFGTALYLSDDGGQTWSRAQETPGTTAATMFDIVRYGDQLIAVGTAIWASDDDGQSWNEVAEAATLQGTLYAVDVYADTIVAAGDGGDGELAGPPALALVSSDGQTWERTVLDSEAGARSVAIGETGRIVVAGDADNDASFWVSDDTGETWEAIQIPGMCCVRDLVVTPTGYAAATRVMFEGALMSADGMTWTPTNVTLGLTAVAWGPNFGLVAVADEALLRAPALAP